VRVLKEEGQKEECSNVNKKKAKHIISCAFAQLNNESASEKKVKKLKFCSNVYIKKAKHIISCALAQPNTESASEILLRNHIMNH
jgi:hypothetical protein